MFYKSNLREYFIGININYINRLHFYLVISVHFDKSLINPKLQAARIMVQIKIALLNPRFTEFVEHSVLQQILQQQIQQ